MSTPSHVVRLDGNKRIIAARKNDSEAKTYEYMREFAAWLITKSDASADLKARVNKFYTDLRTATRKDGDVCLLVPGTLPSRELYLELVSAYNAEIDNKTPATERPAPAARAPRSAPVAAPVVSPASEPAPQQAPVVERDEAPAPAPVAEPAVAPATNQSQPVAQKDDSEAPAWFSSFREELQPTLRDARLDHKILHGESGKPGLIQRVEILEQHCLGDAEQDQPEGGILDRFEPARTRRPRDKKSKSGWDFGRIFRPYRHEH